MPMQMQSRKPKRKNSLLRFPLSDFALVHNPRAIREPVNVFVARTVPPVPE